MAHAITHTHSYQHFEDLQLSANAVYADLEKLIKEYQYPKVNCVREILKEGGLFSSKREYLCISNSNADFYVCAAPFGKSFFISWWLKELAPQGDLEAFFSKLLYGRSNNRNKSYYEIDTELMFTQSIQSIIKMLINKIMVEHGFRNSDLTEPAITV